MVKMLNKKFKQNRVIREKWPSQNGGQNDQFDHPKWVIWTYFESLICEYHTKMALYNTM